MTPLIAAALLLAPQTIAVVPGQSFTLALAAAPGSTPVYTASAHLVYDPTLLQETAFSLAPDWLEINAPAYDFVDNARGAVIKTAGYPGGIATTTLFASVTFTAIKSGSATAVIAGDSLALGVSSSNILGGDQGIAVITIGATANARAPSQASFSGAVDNTEEKDIVIAEPEPTKGLHMATPRQLVTRSLQAIRTTVSELLGRLGLYQAQKMLRPDWHPYDLRAW